MPLVTGQSTNPSNPTEEWQNKLVGKTLHDEESGATTFCKKDLPEGCRVIKPGTMVTKDFKEDRLNVHLDDEGIVTHVLHG
ncbi:peptidase inhibitor i78 family domain-containing protein [Emericellopsis cladophorae]|uniref:Peptidase inhibitor i78 family domain-containing protein n=1 Tax=Emericellopsis cladophorae TaxID=2686198 RepID=A0A9P9XX52_9HYPO|nr:peptidase inhibitor i78 family domain-containing protein [Emericellopsis cladophorae]KAI6779335.1 peptidase inhibitor i78 family domain-containing protein [Emericellopsis cladophorae]